MLVRKATTTSTMDDAKALARDGAAHGTTVVARRQTAGRGREGRTWTSGEGGIHLSIVLRPATPPAKWGILPLGIGAHLCAALRALGVPADLKWPNDILVGEAKLAGILLESRPADGVVVAGVGLNHTAAPDGAARLCDHAASPPDADALIALIRDAALAAAAVLDARGPEPLRASARRLCTTLGQRVTTQDGDVGVAADLAPDGGLVVATATGERTHHAGDIRIVRGPSATGGTF